MQQYILRRLLLFAPTLLGVVVLVFLVMRVLPGDIAVLKLMGAGEVVDPKELAMVREQLGLDKPLVVQFGTYLWGLMRGDLGESWWFPDTSVGQVLRSRFPLSLELAFLGTLLTAFVAIPAGVLAAVRQNTWIDYVVRSIAIAGLSMPTFWVGIILILILVIFFGWLPPLTYRNPMEDLGVNLQILIWPALTMALRQTAVVLRMARATMLEVLREDYIRTAWSKGLARSTVYVIHALRNAMLPVVTVLGIEFALAFGGLVITETVFNLPGMGRVVVDAVLRRDYPLIQAVVTLMALIVLVVNLLIDLSYAWLDPRIRYK